MPFLQQAKNMRLLVGAMFVGLLAALLVVSLASQSRATDAPNAADQFSVLNRAGNPGLDSLPSEVQSVVARLSYSPDFVGQKPSKVGIANLDSGDQVAVSLIGERICAQVVESGLGTCAEPGVAATGSIFGASPIGCGAYSVVGLMPDGVSSLLVDEQDDGSIDGQIAVSSNVYLATLKPVATVLSSSDGKVRVQLPLDWYAADNDACS